MKNSSPQNCRPTDLKLGELFFTFTQTVEVRHMSLCEMSCVVVPILVDTNPEVWRGIGFRTRSVYIEYQDPYLNIVVNRATFLLFSSVSHFKSFRIFVTVPGVVLYSFVTKRAIRLCTLSMLNVQIACTTSILKPWRQFKFLEARQTNVKTIWSIVTSAGIVI